MSNYAEISRQISEISDDEYGNDTDNQMQIATTSSTPFSSVIAKQQIGF